MEKDNLKTLLDYLIFLQPQIGRLINMEDITMHQAELAELERLAEIGRATEKAFEDAELIIYTAKYIYDNDTKCKSVKELLNWSKED